jgi:hypothetical protein
MQNDSINHTAAQALSSSFCDANKIQAVRLFYQQDQRTAIEQPRPEDVLSIRGFGGNKHPGNKKFRQLIHSVKHMYVTSKSAVDRRTLSEGVLAELLPGRILKKKHPSDAMFQFMDYEESLQKIFIAARDARRTYTKSPNNKAATAAVAGGKEDNVMHKSSSSSSAAAAAAAPVSSSSPNKRATRGNRPKRKYDRLDTASANMDTNAKRRRKTKDDSHVQLSKVSEKNKAEIVQEVAVAKTDTEVVAPVGNASKKDTTNIVQEAPVAKTDATKNIVQEATDAMMDTQVAAVADAAVDNKDETNVAPTAAAASTKTTTGSVEESSVTRMKINNLTQEEENEIIQWVEETVQMVPTNSSFSTISDINTNNAGAKRRCEDIFHRIHCIVNRGSQERRKIGSTASLNDDAERWFTPSHQKLVYLELLTRCKSAMGTGMSHVDFLNQFEANLVF